MPSLQSGGVKFYSESSAPKYLKKSTYGTFSQSWVCSNIKLQKALGSITYSTFMGLIFGGIKGGVTGGIEAGAKGFTTSAFYQLVKYDRKSKNISYIDYTARSKRNARYYKYRRYTYAKAKFKGKRVTTYSYGIML